MSSSNITLRIIVPRATSTYRHRTGRPRSSDCAARAYGSAPDLLLVTALVTSLVMSGNLCAKANGCLLPSGISALGINYDTAFGPTDNIPGLPVPFNYPLCDGNTNLPCSPVTWHIPVSRVVGNAWPFTGVLNQDGTLAAPAPLIANGVVSALAYLPIQVSGAPDRDYTVQVIFNGQTVDTGTLHATGNPNIPSVWNKCVKIDIGKVRFPYRVKPGSTPTPVVNTVEFVSYDPQAAVASETYITTMVGPLSFDAMAPVVLVHGWRAGPWWWGPSNPTNNDQCGADLNFAQRGYGYNGGFNFIQPLIDNGMPFDCSITIGQTDSIQDGATELGQKLPDVLASFGAKHAHLVAHSKGGMWTREMLKNWMSQSPPPNLGLYSLTTLSTPHQGSSLADLLVAAHWGIWFPIRHPKLLGPFLARYDKGAFDLRVLSAEAWNATTGRPPEHFTVDGIQNDAIYYAWGGDADVNSDGVITGANTPGGEGYPGPFLGSLLSFADDRIQNGRYRELGRIQQLNYTIANTGAPLKRVPHAPFFQDNSSFQYNDLAVIVQSAMGAFGFIPEPANVGARICNSLPCLVANHSTMGVANITLIGLIQAAQPVK